MEKAVITCGGTGGHFYPGLSIARHLLQGGTEVRMLLSGVHSRHQGEIARSFGLDVEVLPEMPSPGRSPKRWVQFMGGLAGGFFQARRHMMRFSPDFVIGMGSFASLPVIFAAKRLGIPVFLHDGNARIGKANRMLSRFARFTATAFPAVNAARAHGEVFYCGMPIRPELETRCSITKTEAIEGLRKCFSADLDAKRFTILIFGGSQGAAVFNRVLPEALTKLAGAFDFQLLHLTGKGKLSETLALYENAFFPRVVIESDERMELFLGAADLAFCRSGGSTVAELALFGKPAVLIPYPFAAEQHQTDNARFYVNAGAAELVENSEFTPRKAEEVLTGYLQVPERLAAMSGCAVKAAEPDAAERFIKEIKASLNSLSGKEFA